MTAAVFPSLEEAKTALEKKSKRHRAYAISFQGRTLYTVATSRQLAFGEVAAEFGLQTQLIEPRYSNARLARLVAQLSLYKKTALLQILQSQLSGHAEP